MAFTVTKLVNAGYLVEGTDTTGKDGSVVLESPTWDYITTVKAHAEAGEAFDEATKAFFAPIVEAAELAKAIAHPHQDVSTYTITEQVEGVRGESLELDSNGILLNLIDQGKEDQLRWVNDSLVAIAV